jgi:hypothetical protein
LLLPRLFRLPCAAEGVRCPLPCPCDLGGVVVIVGGGAPFAESDMVASRVKEYVVGRVRD